MSPFLQCILLAACVKQGAPSHSGDGDSGAAYTSLATSSMTTCVRDTEGMVTCWGIRDYPLFGAGDLPENEQELPWGFLRIGPGIPEQISTTFHTLCWLDEDSDVGCLGGSFWGIDIPKVKKFVPVTGGYFAILPDGTVSADVPWRIDDIPEQTVDVIADDLRWCFGLSDGTWECFAHSPVGPQLSIDVLMSTGCALGTTGTVQCWSLDDGSEKIIVAGQVDWTEIKLTDHVACGLGPDRTAECKMSPEVSDATTWHGPDLASREPVKMMDCTWYSCCAVLDSGALDCWGWGELGEIPDFVSE